MADSHKPKTLTLVQGAIRRGDTIEPWTFSVSGIPSPDDAVFKLSMHSKSVKNAPVLELDSITPDQIEVEVDGTTINGTVPRINVPTVGPIVWELQARVPTISVAKPAGGKWTRTLFEGTIRAEQDGADKAVP